MEPGSDTVLRVEGLTKEFGRFRALDGIEIVLERPGVYGFLGPNGAGKTTTFRIICGLLRPTAGRVVIEGVDLGSNTPEAVSRLGVLNDSPAFYPYLSARGNLEVFSRWMGIESPGRMGELLGLVGLDRAGRKKVGEYSWGMKRRLGLAAALLGDPSLLLLDEPTNGLDPAGIAEIRRLLPRLALEGRTVLLSSHRMEEVSQICDHVTIINRGVVVASGSPSELAAGTGGIVVSCSEPDRARRLLSKMEGIERVEKAGRGILTVFTGGVEPSAINARLVSEGIEVRSLEAGRESLEEVFFRLTGEEGER